MKGKHFQQAYMICSQPLFTRPGNSLSFDKFNETLKTFKPIKYKVSLTSNGNFMRHNLRGRRVQNGCIVQGSIHCRL